jgi:hypothetical protein
VFVALAGLALAPLAAAAQDGAAAEGSVADGGEAVESPATAEDSATVVAVAEAEPEAAVQPAARLVTVPRLTPVLIELLATLSSETSTTGDRFPLRLAEALMIDGETVIPAGTTGEGEVIHAKRKGGMGAAGDLILTARFLDLGGQHIALRSLRINGDGQSRIDTVNSLAVASAATIPLASLVGFFITGGAKTVNEGTIAAARTAEDVALSLAAVPEQAAPSPAAEPVSEAELGNPPDETSTADETGQQGSIMEGQQE